MPTNVCTKTDKTEWSSGWVYVGAYPAKDPVTGHAPGAIIGTADVIYIWKRKFKVKYECTCKGQTAEVWVDGNYKFHYQEVTGVNHPITGVPMPNPLKGALGDVADLLGVIPEAMYWWLNMEQVDGMKPAGPEQDDEGTVEDLRKPPYIECGDDEKQIRLADGTPLPWPPDGTEANDSLPYIELACPTGTASHGEVALGWAERSSAASARNGAIAMAQVLAGYRANRIKKWYRCAKPCDPEPAVSITFDGEDIGLEPTETKDKTWICIAYVPWMVTVTCNLRTGMLNEQGEHYGKGTFVATAEGSNKEMATIALADVAKDKAWEAGVQVLMDSHYDEASRATPFFRVNSTIELLEHPGIEGQEGYTAAGHVSWHLELADMDRAQQQQITEA